MIKYYFIGILLFSIVSCKTASITNQRQQLAFQNTAVLGAIGLDKTTVVDLKNTFSPIGLPHIEKPVRVSVTKTDFSKQTYAHLSEIAPNKAKGIKYVDSLDNKPSFLKLQLTDLTSLVKNLHSEKNIEIHNYLESQPKAKMVTAFSIVTSPEEQNKLLQAQTVNLKSNGHNEYELQIINDSKIREYIKISDAIVLTYDLSRFCWGLNKRNQPEIKSVVGSKCDCGDDTHIKASKAIKKEPSYLRL